MKITICGSMQFADDMEHIKDQLEVQGYEVEAPHFLGRQEANSSKMRAEQRRALIDEYFAKIDTSDAILVVNNDKHGTKNYIGGNTLMEMTYAYAHGLEVFLLNPVPDCSYTEEILALHPILLDGDLTRIDQYFASLPLVYISTTSPIKHTAVSRAMRHSGIPVRVDGTKVETGVNEQPMTIEETYEGVMNRHKNLKRLHQAAEYYVSVESGQHPAHARHSMFGCAVIVIEKVGQEPKIGIDLDVEFPQDMLDKVPSQYPDLGVLVQQEYGSKLKDPYPHFTRGKLTRQRVLENAIYNVAIQLEM